jgi:hypothetical protein
MKKAILKKTSGFLAALLLLTVLVPVLASAAIQFSNTITYSTDGTVSGTVYFAQGSAPTGSVYLQVYRPDGSLKQVYAQNPQTASGSVYYSFSDFVGVYNAVYLLYMGQKAGPYFAQGSSYFPPATPGPTGSGTTLNLGAATSIDAAQLTALLAAGDNVTLTITGETLTLPASALATNEEGVVTISNGTASISLPVEALDLEELAKELGITLAQLQITVTLDVLTGDAAAEATAAAEEADAEIIGPVIDFTITATGPNGVSREITSFGDTFVTKTITLPAAAEAATSTAVVLNEETDEFQFVPSTFAGTTATIMTNHNSIYTVLSVDRELFADVPATHWAAEDIQLLSNKLIVSGVSETEFQPTRNITRAEFAALVVRSLGLATGDAAAAEEGAEEEGFSDVVGSAWYADAVAAASEAGLIAGYPDGTFRPNQTITRAELASLVVRALNFAGNESELTAAEQADILGEFKDVDQVGTWARGELAVAVQAGIVLGVGADTLAPNKTATRAEATAMLARYLREAGFINE